TMSGTLLSAELLARGLVKRPDRSVGRIYYTVSRDDVVESLRSKLLLVDSSGEHYFRSYYYDPTYPKLTLHPAMIAAVPAATPLPWKPSSPPVEVKSGVRR